MPEKYALSSKDLYNLLVEKGVKFLYHANSIATSLTFIQQGCLLSRQEAEQNALIQSPQGTDKKDKDHGIWDSIFIDSADLHQEFSVHNVYGPVLFQLKLDLLLADDFPEVFITRYNPNDWEETTPLNNKFYSSIEEVKNDYGREGKLVSDIMFTFRGPARNLKLSEYLNAIILDDPKTTIDVFEQETDAFPYLNKLLSAELQKFPINDIKVQLREHPFHCECKATYNFIKTYKSWKFERLFSRYGHPDINV